MNNMEIFFYILIALFFLIAGFLIKTFLLIYKKKFSEYNLNKKIKQTEEKIKKIINNSEDKAKDILLENQKIIDDKFKESEIERKRLFQKDQYLDERQKYFNKRELEYDELKKELIKREEKYSEKNSDLKKELECICNISSDEALEILTEKIEKEHAEDLFISIQKMKKFRQSDIEEKAKGLLSLALQKCSKDLDTNLVTSTVHIENEEIKGKIIGKDGRNIRSFERMTGVQLLIDKTPNIITISSFDPIRREVAKISLKKLIENKIVHPAKIEDAVLLAQKEVEETIKEKGEQAALEIGVYNIPEELLNILGRLHYRTSYGQNILTHSLEVAHMAKSLAEEIGANVEVAKIAGLFHDIGKAVDFEIQGSHVDIGCKILKKYGMGDEIIFAMKSHHGEYPNKNLESYLVDTADSISGSRKGARNDNTNMYIQKLEGLERITKEFDGVLESYALSAGREIRVFVKPSIIDDYKASQLARDIALRIEEELKYPGEIKIAIIRETKIIDYAR